jgi:hypothetical protein
VVEEERFYAKVVVVVVVVDDGLLSQDWLLWYESKTHLNNFC